MNGVLTALRRLLPLSVFWKPAIVALGLLGPVRMVFPQEVAWFRGTEAEEQTIAVDANGIYLAGRQCYGRRCDGVVAMRGLNGVERWRRQFSIFGTTEPFDVAVHRTGIYVAGRADVKIGDDYQGYAGFVRKYDFEGNEIWTSRLSPVFEAWSVAVDDSGVYFSGAGFVKATYGVVGRLDFAGKVVWMQSLGAADGAFSIALHGARIYTTTENRKGAYGDHFLWALDQAGNVVDRFDIPDFLGYDMGSLAVDDSGIYVSNFTGLVVKYDYAGVELWRHQVPYESLAQAGVITVDSGTVYFGASSKPHNTEIRGLDTQGNELWRRQWLDGNPNALAVRNGKIYAAGFSGARYLSSGGFLLAIDPSLHYRNLNRSVTFEPQPGTFHRLDDGRGCNSYISQNTKATFTAKLANQTDRPLRHLQFGVRSLAGPGNTLLVGDEWASRNSRFFVPRVGEYADGVLGPGEAADIPVTVCQRGPYRFYLALDVFGMAGAAH